MQSYTLGLYEKAMPSTLTWLEKLTAAKEAGFDYLEMSLDETDAKLARLTMSLEERAEIRQAIEATGIPIHSICLSGHRKYPLGSHEEAVRTRALEIMEQAIDLAADLGVRIIQLAGYDVYYEEGDATTRDYFIRNLEKAVQMAAAKGVILGFETMETEFMNTMGKAMNYVHQIHSPYLGVYPDVGNLTNAAVTYGEEVTRDIALGEGHVFAVHLKETVPGKFREIPFGTGHVDFPKVIDAFWQQGVRRFTGEFWYVGAEDWQGELQKAHDFLRVFFAKYKK